MRVQKIKCIPGVHTMLQDGLMFILKKDNDIVLMSDFTQCIDVIAWDKSYLLLNAQSN